MRSERWNRRGSRLRAQVVGTPDLAILALTVLARGCLRTQRPHLRSRADSAMPRFASELRQLRRENAALREIVDAGSLDRPGTPATLAACRNGGSEEGWDALTEATVMRTTLSALCEDLQMAVVLLQSRLADFVDEPEIADRSNDRRVECLLQPLLTAVESGVGDLARSLRADGDPPVVAETGVPVSVG